MPKTKNSTDHNRILRNEVNQCCIQDSITLRTDEMSKNSSTLTDVSTHSNIKSSSLPVAQDATHLLYSSFANDELNEQLRNLVAQACKHPSGSQERQKLLTKIIRLTQNKLWKENTPYYQDALQQTWLYFCRNVCDGLTGQAYDPNQGSLITWLNAYLKRRLQDFYINQNREQNTTVSLRVRQSNSGDVSETINPIDNLPATPQAPPILENLEIWVKADSDGELHSTHVKGHPEVNCQVLILKRLPPEMSWKELSEEFNLPIPTLSSFYQRQCLPRLRKFAELEGLL